MGPARAQLLRDLLAVELDLRLENGEQPDRVAYRHRLPGHEHLVDAVFASRGGIEEPQLAPRLLETEPPSVDGPGNNQPTIDVAANDSSTIDAPRNGQVNKDRRGETELSTHNSGRSFTLGYEILDELGRGGMGIVYRARQVALNRLVALKVIKSAEFASEAELIRFQNEAEAVERSTTRTSCPSTRSAGSRASVFSA